LEARKWAFGGHVPKFDGHRAEVYLVNIFPEARAF
jgi:hypothetical protein